MKNGLLHFVKVETSHFIFTGDTFEDGHKTDLDYSGGMEKEFEDYDKFYDDYEADTISGATPMSCLSYWISVVLVVSLRCLGLVS